MKTFYIILAAVLISIVAYTGIVIYFLNYVPFGAMDFLFFNKPQNFGTTLTDLQSSDTMSVFPTLYNANNLALNNGKIEVSSSSIAAITTLSNLTSIGTIATGVWQGTAIGVGYNGTGTTTPTLNQVMLGNGASGFKVVGFGTSGQFLTSNGAASAPSWQTAAINQADNYTWTGSHTFNLGILSVASTTFNSLNYQWPAIRGVASSTLTDNGSGGLSFSLPSRLLHSTTTDVVIGSTLATSTVMSMTIPANYLGLHNVIRFRLNVGAGLVQTSPRSLNIDVIYGGQEKHFLVTAGATTNIPGYLEGTITPDGATNAQELFVFYNAISTSDATVFITQSGIVQDTTVDTTASQTLVVEMSFSELNENITISNSYVELLAY